MTSPETAAAALPNAASATQSASQAARTARRAAFRDAFTRPPDEHATAEHDRAVQAVIDQLHPQRRVPRW